LNGGDDLNVVCKSGRDLVLSLISNRRRVALEVFYATLQCHSGIEEYHTALQFYGAYQQDSEAPKSLGDKCGRVATDLLKKIQSKIDEQWIASELGVNSRRDCFALVGIQSREI